MTLVRNSPWPIIPRSPLVIFSKRENVFERFLPLSYITLLISVRRQCYKISIFELGLFSKKFCRIFHSNIKIIQLLNKIDNCKAYFKRAKAHKLVWNLDESIADFQSALKINQSLSTTVKNEIAEIVKLKQLKNAEDKNKFRKLFGN